MSERNPGSDPFHLQRFLDAQERTYAQARAELAAGEKRSHWMWFIFPQIQGLGSSSMARRYAITDRSEAQAYLAHPVLGERLRECTSLALTVPQRSVSEIFGFPDDMNFHSSMTLFASVAAGGDAQNGVFAQALTKFFGGRKDKGTMDRL